MKDLLKTAIERNWAFWICLIFSIILMLLGFFLPWPPDGTVDGSILAGIGELFGFGALGAVISALDKGKDAKIIHGNTTFQLGDDKNEGYGE